MEKATEEGLSARLPSEFQGVEVPEWSAQRVVGAEIPLDADLQALIADPWFDDSVWAEDGQAARREKVIGLVEGWEKELAGTTVGAGYEEEEVTRLLQQAVAAKLVKGRLLLAEGSETDGAESVRQALTMAREGLETGPGLHGLNQTVPVLMSAEIAVLTAQQPGVSSADRELYLLNPLRQFDFRAVAKRKLKEYAVLEVLPRVVNVGRSENVAATAASLMGSGEEVEVFLPFAEGALGKDGGAFDAEECLAISAGWISDLVAALDSGWAEVEAVLAERDQMLVDTWGVNPFALEGLDSSSVKAPKGSGKKMLPVLFAYEITQSVVPMLESAMVAQMTVDAAELSVMMADASSEGVRVRDLGALDSRFPKAAGSLVDPLTGESYEIDFGSRRIQTRLRSVSEKRFLLGAVVDTGLPF